MDEILSNLRYVIYNWEYYTMWWIVYIKIKNNCETNNNQWIHTLEMVSMVPIVYVFFEFSCSLTWEPCK